MFSVLLSASVLALSTAAAATSTAPSTPVATAASTADIIVVHGRYLYNDQVNALKTPTPVLDVPQSLSIITGEEIQLRGFTSVADIINYTPGVSNSQGEGHRDAVVFRGVRSTADFFIDGVRDDVEYFRPLYNLEQVEILRGPNALFFGRGGTGGILNRVTKKAEIGEDFTGYRASANTFGAYDIWFDHNVTAGEGTAFRINAMVEQLDNHRDFFDGQQIGINPTAKFQFSPATTLDLSYEYVDHQRFIDRGIPTGTDGRPVEAFQDIVFGDPELNTADLEAHLWRARLQHRFADNLKGRLTAFYGDYDKLYQNFYVSDYNEAVAPDVAGLDGYVDTTERQNLIIAGDLVGEFTTGRIGHTIVTGAEYINTVNNNDRFNPVWDQTNDDVEFFSITRPLNLAGGVGVNASGQTTRVAFTDLADDTEADVRVFSAYVQDEIELSEKLDLVLGVRFDSFEIDVLNVPTNDRRSRTDERFSPRLGLVFKPQENVSLYTSYSETFLPRSGDQFANINGDADALDPDTFSNLEAGVKWDFAENLSFTAAAFEIQQSSPQVADSDPETLDVIESETTGFEFQLQGEITDRWAITGGYSFLDGEIVDRSGGTGLRPRELPEHMFSIWNAVQVSDKFGFGVGATYQDESFINNSNTAVLPSYTRVDAALYYDLSEKLRLQVNVENLTDELYFPTSHSTHEATVAPPLNARLTISGRF